MELFHGVPITKYGEPTAQRGLVIAAANG
jgi:hypothetical protein